MKETAEERKEKGRRGFKSMRTKDSERIERKREREFVEPRLPTSSHLQTLKTHNPWLISCPPVLLRKLQLP